MAAKIPVTVITGFLGSGKTTLIRHLLQNNQGRRIAVLVNEFGELGIDGELLKSCQCPNGDDNIYELTNGCLCCTVQEEFLPTMQELLKRRSSIDCILIETSGLALPKPLLKAFRWQEIKAGATVDAVITVVDCLAVANGTFASNPQLVGAIRQADDIEHETPLQELFEDQLACADLVILNKTDLVNDEAKSQVEKIVKQLLPRDVKIVESSLGALDPEIVLGWNAAVEDNLDRRPLHHHDTEEDHDHDDEITSTHFVFNQSFDPEALQSQLQSLVQMQDIYRIKGFVSVPNKAMRLVMQGVGTRFDKFYDRPWLKEEERQTKLVFIGRDLDASKIESAIARK